MLIKLAAIGDKRHRAIMVPTPAIKDGSLKKISFDDIFNKK